MMHKVMHCVDYLFNMGTKPEEISELCSRIITTFHAANGTLIQAQKREDIEQIKDEAPTPQQLVALIEETFHPTVKENLTVPTAYSAEVHAVCEEIAKIVSTVPPMPVVAEERPVTCDSELFDASNDSHVQILRSIFKAEDLDLRRTEHREKATAIKEGAVGKTLADLPTFVHSFLFPAPVAPQLF